MNFNPNNQTQQNNFDFALTFKRILKKWYILVIFLVVALTAAFFYNQYSVPKFKVEGLLEVENDGDMQYSNIFNQFGNKDVNLVNRTILFRSVPILYSTLQELDFAVNYYDHNPLNLIELYKKSPIRLDIDATSSFIPYGELWKCEFVDNKKYNLITPENTYQVNYGEKANINDFIFSIKLKDAEKLKEYGHVLFKVNELYSLIQLYKNKVEITPVKEESTILSVSLTGESPEKEIDFLNNLMEKIIEHDVSLKRKNSEKTVQFIDDQLTENSDSLQSIEGQIKRFKYTQVPVDPSMESNQLYNNIKQLEDQKANILLSNQYYDYLLESLNDSENVDEIVVPSSMGVQDNVLNNMISRLVELQLDVKLFAADKNSKNAIVQKKIETINELKTNIITNVENLKARNDISLKDINDRINLYSSSLRKLPEAERQLKNIQRNYNINEEIYLLLMQKRLEAGIRFAAIESDYRIVNQASNVGPVSAGPAKIYILAVLLALALPIGSFVLVDYLSDKIRSKDEVKAATNIPIIGSILHQEKGESELQDKPSFESFRAIRTNLKFLKQPTQVLMFSSSIAGEGKSFCSTNLALLLAMSDNKVVWIDADLRKENKAYEVNNQNLVNGLSSYLSGSVDLDSIIIPGRTKNLSIIKSGIFPPNPGELLVGDKMKELIMALRQNFDYVIVDTPPIGFFSDAFEVISYTDHTFILVRENYSKKTAFNATLETINQKKVNNMVSLIYNDFEDEKHAYGYGYGAGYYGKKSKRKKQPEEVIKL